MGRNPEDGQQWPPRQQGPQYGRQWDPGASDRARQQRPPQPPPGWQPPQQQWPPQPGYGQQVQPWQQPPQPYGPRTSVTVKPISFAEHIFHFCMCFPTCGLWVIVWIARAAGKRKETTYYR